MRTGEDMHHGGFAGAIGADQRHDLPGPDLQIHALKYVRPAVARPQALDTEYRVHADSSTLLPRYADMTRGSLRARSGEPLKIVLPNSRT